MPTTSTKTGIVEKGPISKREFLAYSSEVKFEILRQIRLRVEDLTKSGGFDQVILAKRLGVNKSIVSRRLRGENDMGIETLSDLARGLDCRIDVKITPLDNIVTRSDLGDLPFKFLFSMSQSGAVFQKDTEKLPVGKVSDIAVLSE